MKTFGFLLLSLVLMSAAQGQSTFKEWQDGPLSWDDFKEDSELANPSYLEYALEIERKNEKIGDTIYSRLIAVAHMDRRASKVRPDEKSPLLLEYNQIIFDLLEYHRRKLQYRLDDATTPREADAVWRETSQELRDKLERMEYQTNSGRNPTAVEEWDGKTSSLLHNLKPETVPEIERTGYGLGLYLGMGAGFYHESVSDLLRDPFVISLQIQAEYNRALFLLNFGLAPTTAKMDYRGNDTALAGDGLMYFSVSLAFGYRLIDAPGIKISPFLGPSYYNISYIPENEDQQGYGVDDNFNFTAGLMAEFTVRRKAKLVPEYHEYFPTRELVNTNITLRAAVDQLSFAPGTSGYFFNFTIGVSAIGEYLK